MNNKNIGPIIIRSAFPLKPLERNIWRQIGFVLNHSVTFQSSDEFGYTIIFGDKRVSSPQEKNFDSYRLYSKNFVFEGKEYNLLTPENFQITHDDSDIIISVDIWSPIIYLLTLYEERNDLTRDRYGLFLGVSTGRYKSDENSLMADYLLQHAKLLAQLIGLSFAPFWPGSPYVVALTFDVDGFYPNQPQKIINFIKKWPVERPTFMLMGVHKEDATIYDPIYNLEDPELNILWESDIEIGLHSSYIAHDNLDLLQKQKRYVEKLSGRRITGHRSHYYRFAFPRSWGQQLRTGFLYDASLGFPDLPGNRNGTNLPVFFPDPDGFSNKLWTISTTFLDQHFFNENNYFYWLGEGKKTIDRHFQYLKSYGGMITLDWHLHCLDNINFPYHYEILSYILNKAAADGAVIVGLNSIIEVFEERWKRLFQDEYEWRITNREVKITSLLEREISIYIDAFNKKNLGSNYLDNSIMSFLLSLPDNAETILDIGSGPGLVSKRIPPFHRVICMDLNEEILAPVLKPKYFGDITSIPLESKSVDLVLACDVLEHLDGYQLEKAIKELERVSRRYIYIQTPLEEPLDAGIAECPGCGYKWHVNFHKQSFSLNRLNNILNNEWKVNTVNFTGEVSIFNYPHNYYNFSLQMKRTSFEVDCPDCGYLIKNNMDYPFCNTLKGVFSHEVKDLIAPRYSEIGILYELEKNCSINDKTSLRLRSGERREIPSPYVIETNCLDFSMPYYETDSYTGFEMVPTLIPHQIILLKKNTQLVLIKSELAENPSLGVSLPVYLEEKDVIHLEGFVEVSTDILIYGISSMNNELPLGKYTVDQHFSIDLIVNKEFAFTKCFLRIIWHGGCELALSKVYITNLSKEKEKKTLYLYTGMGEFSHIESVTRGIIYRWLVPHNGMLVFSESFTDWISKMIKEIKECKIYKELYDYIDRIECYTKTLELDVFKEKDHAGIQNKYAKDLEEYNLRMREQLKRLEEDNLRKQNTLELLEDEIVRNHQELNEYKKDKEILPRYIGILEEEILRLSIYGSHRIERHLFKKIVGKVIRKIILFIKRGKLSFLLRVAERIGLRRVYQKIRIRGWA